LELAYLLPNIQSCGRQVADSGLLFFESLVPPLPGDSHTLTIWLGEPPTNAGYAAALGAEEIVLLVNENNGVSGIEAAETRAIFSGMQGSWDADGPPVTIWYPLQGSASARAFENRIGSIRISPNAFLAPSPAVAAEQVALDSGGITILPAGWLVPGLRVAASLGELPVTALSQAEPIGPLRQLVSCLQADQLFSSP
jgi:hypothetical protein